MAPSVKHTIADCLANLGIADASVFGSCVNLEDEWKIIRRIYLAKVLQEHPDKGGDAGQFRTTQTALEVLRELYQTNKVRKDSFAVYMDKDNQDNDEDAMAWDDIFAGFGSSEVPSYEYYAQAAEEEMPIYKLEAAKTGRSQCIKCKSGKGKKAAAPVAPEEPTASAPSVAADVAVSDAVVTKPPRRRAAQKAANAIHNTLSTATPTTTIGPNYISRGDLRVGSINDVSGSYGRWHHIPCWRVPSKVWDGLTDPTHADTVWHDLLQMDQVLLTGVADLDEEHRHVLVKHVMEKQNWARKYKKKGEKPTTNNNQKRPAEEEQTKEGDGLEGTGDAKRAKTTDNNKTEETGQLQASSNALATIQQRFQIPRPGRNGAMTDDYLDGKRFVLTGIFPEIGGGKGLNQGKDKVKAMIEAFGGIVTGSVSGKTNYLIVGKEPGASKVGNAKQRGLPLMDLRTVRELLMGEVSFEQAEAKELPKIQSFSAGYPTKMIAN